MAQLPEGLSAAEVSAAVRARYSQVGADPAQDFPFPVGRTFAALGRENVNIIAIAQGSSECNISFVAKQQDVSAALAAIHQEFQLGTLNSRAIPVRSMDVVPTAWHYESDQRTASAD